MFVADFKDRDGNWIKSFREKVSQKHVKTTSCNYWDNMLMRCNEKNSIPENYQHYRGTTHTFKNFQHFAEWCNEQAGYYNDGWHLDKDILSNGSKVYCPETSVFVPREVNAFFLQRGRMRGKWPIGVHQYKYGFEACCNTPWKKSNYIGKFSCPISAFNAYREVKMSVGKFLSLKWEGRVDPRVCAALLNFEPKIDD